MSHEQPSLPELDPNPERLGGPEAIQKELDRVFDYHKPVGHIVGLHETWCFMVKKFAAEIMSLPTTRERAMAITRLEETSFWIHACIARNHDKFPGPFPGPPVEAEG